MSAFLEPPAHGGDGAALAARLGVDPKDVLDLSASLNPVAPDVAPLVAAHAEGFVTDDTGIVSLVLLGASVNAVLSTTGTPGDATWSWTVTAADLLAPATAILLATDEDGHTTTLVLDLEARSSIVIPALDGAGLLLLGLLLAAAGALFLRRLG